MKLLNYTTEIDASRTIGEIISILAQSGANQIMQDFDATGQVTAIAFAITTKTFGLISYKLPANVDAAVLVLNAQVKKTGRDKIPGRYYNNRDQARRIAWRIVRDWIEAQLAIVQLGQVSMDQVMLPFAVTDNGETFYQRMLNRGTLSLEAPKAEEPRNVTDI